MSVIVGVGVLIKKNNKILLGKRVSKHGKGTWSPPGGKLDEGESFEACAKREVKEECGIDIDNVKFLTCTNNIFSEEGVHTITLFMTADYVSGEPQVLEPDKLQDWRWFENLPEPLFLPVINLLKQDYDIFKS